MSFTFEFEVAEDEHVRASRAVAFRRPATKGVLAFLVAAAVVVSALFAGGVLGALQDCWLILLTAWAALVGGIAGSYAAPKSVVQNLRKNNRAAAGPHVYNLTDAGLEMRSPGAATSLQWANIPEVYETREFLLFYFSAGWAQLLPKRVVPADALVSLRAALVEWVGPRARLLA